MDGFMLYFKFLVGCWKNWKTGKIGVIIEKIGKKKKEKKREKGIYEKKWNI